MINLGKIPRSLGFYIPVKHSQGLFSPSLSKIEETNAASGFYDLIMLAMFLENAPQN